MLLSLPLEVTKILLCAAQASHQLVPPEVNHTTFCYEVSVANCSISFIPWRFANKRRVFIKEQHVGLLSVL